MSKEGNRRRSQRAKPGANGPRGGGRSSLSCPINRSGLCAEGSPEGGWRPRRGGEGREGKGGQRQGEDQVPLLLADVFKMAS